MRPWQTWRWLWPAPWSAFGLLFALAMRASGGRWRRSGCVLECHGGWVAALPWPMVAITFGHVILARDERVMSQWRAHEMVHVDQYERWGSAFVPAYLIESAWQTLRGRHVWHDNRFELAAERRPDPVTSKPPAPARASGSSHPHAR